MASIIDVARAAGVSPSTVSRTFASPSSLNDQTRRRVLAIAEDMKYKPRPMRARVLKTAAADAPLNKFNTIGFVFFGAEFGGLRYDEFYRGILAGAQEEAESLGLNLLLLTVPLMAVPPQPPHLLAQEAVGGMLLVGTTMPGVWNYYTRPEIETVLVDNRDPEARYDCVMTNSLDGTKAATRHLIELGHTRIGFVQEPRKTPSNEDRRCGYASAHLEAGLPLDIRLVHDIASFERGSEDLLRYLTSEDRPTAILCANDQTAEHLMHCCKDAGLRIPADISLVGFDDLDLCRRLQPPLSSISANKHAIGREAIRKLFARMEAKRTGAEQYPPMETYLPSKFIPRASIAAPAA